MPAQMYTCAGEEALVRSVNHQEHAVKKQKAAAVQKADAAQKEKPVEKESEKLRILWSAAGSAQWSREAG